MAGARPAEGNSQQTRGVFEPLLPGPAAPRQPEPLGWHLAVQRRCFTGDGAAGVPVQQSGFAVKVEGCLKIERKYVGNEKVRLNLTHRNNKRQGLGK